MCCRILLVWSADILVPAFVWMTLLGISVAARSSSHVIIDSFIKILPEKNRKQIAVATQVIIACFCIFLVIVGFKVTLAARDSRWGVLHATLGVYLHRLSGLVLSHIPLRY